jgi:hypothetical protein
MNQQFRTISGSLRSYRQILLDSPLSLSGGFLGVDTGRLHVKSLPE